MMQNGFTVIAHESWFSGPGGGIEISTIRSHAKIWTKPPIDSIRFRRTVGYQNPTNYSWRTSEWMVKELHVGAFQPGLSLVNRMNQSAPLSVSTAFTV